MNALESTSTRPYLIRALYDWCTDNGFTPYVAVAVDDTVQVPRDYVKNGEIVLNISFDATSSLKLGNEFIEFKARFGGVSRDIVVPIDRVLAIYARENGQGMAFPVSPPTVSSDPAEPRGPTLASVPGGQQGGPGDEPPAAGRDADRPQLVPVDPTATGEAPDGDATPPTRPSGGARPALKRVK